MGAGSLILSWENPTELFLPTVRSATLYRQLGAMPRVLVKSDITWGMVEDTENSNVAANYLIIYQGPFGENIVSVYDNDIVRYPRPSNIARIDINFTRPDGAPDAGRTIEFSDENSETGGFVRRIVTNTRGKACFFALPNSQLLVRVDGRKYAYNVVIPDVHKITLDELFTTYGSAEDADPRRSIGLNS